LVGVFEAMAEASPDGYEQVVHCADAASGLRAIIAIHSTRLGPALGGTRFYPYPSEAAALADVLRLARAMTYKAAAAGLDLGGGKAVILGDPATTRTEVLIRAYGRFVGSLSGRYITAEDVGTTQADMDLVRSQTPWVTGASPALGGSGDPSEPTAHGVYCAMGAVWEHLSGTASLAGVRVSVSGVGKVGSHLVRRLVGAGARVAVADTNPLAVEALAPLGVEPCPLATIHTLPADIFSPCALAGALNPAVICQLDCRAVVGAANNQLAEPGCARLLADRGVLYAPDYIVNAGGVINIAEELGPAGYHPDRALRRIAGVADTVRAVIATAEADDITTAEAADRMAEARLASVTGSGGDVLFSKLSKEPARGRP